MLAAIIVLDTLGAVKPEHCRSNFCKTESLQTLEGRL
jgi:hypothetical protein